MEWGISLNFKTLKTKLWYNIFIRIAVIFAVFVLILTVCNLSFLVDFFSHKQKHALKEQILTIASLDFNDAQAVRNTISEINEKYNFDIEIYNTQGSIIYTTRAGQMMDFFEQKNNFFQMQHEEMTAIKREALSGGVVFETAIRRFDKQEFLLCRKQINKSLFAEVHIQKQLITQSASIANEFIVLISVICFLLSIIWVLIFAKNFSKPISLMNEITNDMAQLNFKRKLEIKSNDEIGQLALSINELSYSLSEALNNLNETNAKLRDDIELERQLDVMRRGFIANVSHELKTPISIISGYAEGLKLNINPKSNEEYCNTILEESQRMNKLVLSILELSRYESGQIPLKYESFDISPQCSEMLTRIFKGKNIKTENKIPNNTICYADVLQIEQVLKSLLENAAVHTNEGGKVTVSCDEENSIYKISVFNTGGRIDDAVMPQIWQSFYRGDKSHKRESSRFGLGLSIVAAIMKMHALSCGVYNTDDGVCFWFEVKKAEN